MKTTALPDPPSGKNGWPWQCPELPKPPGDAKNEAWPRITIVTPSFNQAQFLEETIRSVLLQGYPNLEYFVVDGGSTDGSVAILEKYSPWLDWWVSEKDRGQADALNKGFARATGELWGYLNSDDVFLPGILHAVSAEYTAVGDRSRFWISYPVEDFGQCAPVVRLPQREYSLLLWVQRTSNIHQPGSFWSAELGRLAGPFDPSFDCTFDRKLFMQFLVLGASPIPRTGRVATRFRLHSESKTVKEHSDERENRFVYECQLLSLEYARYLPGSARRAAADEARQLLMDRAFQRAFGRQSRAARLRELTELARTCPSCVGTRFFWGMVRKVLGSRRVPG
ncbi:MAG: putative teichuronic acid biosynthesis glycosyltransferase TuaG [Acidobacteria bacterium ADurb.Bin051]|nr:MAG: putative teichuronic acid biosynthesis glycosyltransferase TuaG [Acidobacteria bacterium ADurb.Bin051]